MLISGTAAGDNLLGTTFDDTIDGREGPDTISGDSGADIISGGAGRDTISGGDGNDTIYGFSSADANGDTGTINLRLVAQGFESPVFAASAPGDPSHLYVVEKDQGRIRVLDPSNGAIGATLLDLPNSQLTTGGEQGLLGLAFDPGYATNGHFFVYFTNSAGNIEIWRYTKGAGGTASLASGQPILSFNHPFTNHNAGWMAFGPDGYLYIASGDGGSGGDPNNNAQNKGSLLGKILRIDVNGDDFPSDASRNYAIPPTNPFVGVGGAAPEVWAYGLRNPWRPSFDRVTGDLYIADVGQAEREEIDFQAAGAAGGANYGWKVMEGTTVFDDTVPGNPPAGDPSLVAPVLDYGHTGAPNGGSVIIGGYVYRGPYPGAQGLYFFTDASSLQLWTLRVVGGVAQEFENRTSQFIIDRGKLVAPSSFAEDGFGNLYTVDLNGEIHRIDPTIGAEDSNDTLMGDAGDDSIYGGPGDDLLDGGADNDLLSGGTGTDTASGYGARSAYTMLHHGNQVTLSGGTTGTDRLVGIEKIAFSDQTVVLSQAMATRDMDGSGKEALIWQNDDGTPAVWLVDGASFVAGAVTHSSPGITWALKGAADFNGDGKSDFVWQNADGTPALWLMNGVNFISGAPVHVSPGTSWHIKGAGDFDGSGTADILWQNDDGTPALWFMDGQSFGSGGAVRASPGSDWHVISSGDFDGNGKSDILWQNDDGTPAVWLMDGLVLSSASVVRSSPGNDWHIKGAGDFDGDGKSDILWQNDDGSAAIWLMDGTSFRTGTVVRMSPGSDWHVLGAEDTDGDGKADIVWQNDDGTPAIWLMNGTSFVSGQVVRSSPGSDWHLVSA